MFFTTIIHITRKITIPNKKWNYDFHPVFSFILGLIWDLKMQKYRILQLLQGTWETLRKEWLKVLKITNEIQGIGNLMIFSSLSLLYCGISSGSGSLSSGSDSATSSSSRTSLASS